MHTIYVNVIQNQCFKYSSCLTTTELTETIENTHHLSNTKAAAWQCDHWSHIDLCVINTWWQCLPSSVYSMPIPVASGCLPPQAMSLNTLLVKKKCRKWYQTLIISNHYIDYKCNKWAVMTWTKIYSDMESWKLMALKSKHSFHIVGISSNTSWMKLAPE